MTELHRDLQLRNLQLRDLRSIPKFNLLVDAIEHELFVVRQDYENQPASEFNRGRITALRDLLAVLKGQ